MVVFGIASLPPLWPRRDVKAALRSPRGARFFIGPGVLQNTASNLPDDRIGWYAYLRVGGDILTATASRMHAVETTA